MILSAWLIFKVFFIVFSRFRLNCLPGNTETDYVEATLAELSYMQLREILVINNAANLCILVGKIYAVENSVSAVFINKSFSVNIYSVHSNLTINNIIQLRVCSYLTL